MKADKHTGLHVLDCTFRDGGYLNNWSFDTRIVRETYRALSKSGVDYFEIGYRGTEKYFPREKYGLWRFSDENDIREATHGIDGAKIGIMADFGKCDIADFIPKHDSIIDLVRLAAHRDDMKAALAWLADIKALGYETSIQAMGYSSYSVNERAEFCKQLRDTDVDYAYVADSYGSLYPQQIPELVGPLLRLKRVKIGFHPHNNLEMAFANSIEAIRCGVHMIDSSVYGMGRGAGNLKTEVLISYLHDRIPDKFNVIPVLHCIDENFIALQKEIGWGYQLIYMLSGIFQCHPSYAQKLIDFREFTIEDMCRVLECIKRRNPSGFSPELLETILKQGVSGGSKGRSGSGTAAIAASGQRGRAVPYRNRHKGRNFLVLGNGPTIKQYEADIKLFIGKYSPVVLGPNYLGGLFTPDYHVFCNKKRFVKYVDTVSEGSRLLLGQHIPRQLIREHCSREYETISYVDAMDRDFGIDGRGVIQCNCRTVSVLLLGVAIVMGAERIFAAGLDGYLNMDEAGNILFYKESDEKEDRQLLVSMHEWNNTFIRQINDYLLRRGQEGLHILTPTSYSTFYKGIKNYI